MIGNIPQKHMDNYNLDYMVSSDYSLIRASSIVFVPNWRRKEKVMKAFNYTQKCNMNDLADPQQQFTAKMIVKEVQKIAKEHNISEEDPYWAYTHGLYGADREMKND